LTLIAVQLLIGFYQTSFVFHTLYIYIYREREQISEIIIVIQWKPNVYFVSTINNFSYALGTFTSVFVISLKKNVFLYCV